MEFIVEHQAKFELDIELLKEAQRTQGENIDKLTTNVQNLTSEVRYMGSEIKDAIENLIIANEVTRKLAEDIARVSSSMRSGSRG